MRREYWTDIFFRNMSHLIKPALNYIGWKENVLFSLWLVSFHLREVHYRRYVIWYFFHATWLNYVLPEMCSGYQHHGAPFCVLTVKRHCLSLTRLPRVAGGAPAVNHKATAIWLALRISAGNEQCNVCDGNMVSEYIFNFFMATYEWMYPKYVCRILQLFVLYPCQIWQANMP